MKKIMLVILMMFGLVSMANAAESLTQSIKASGPYHVYVLAWVTDSSGNFTATATTQEINGMVLMAEHVPSATAIPTDQYDVVLNNDQGIDVFGGALGNLSNTTAGETMPLLNGNYTAIPVMGTLTFDVTNAGNSKAGTIRIHYLGLD